MWKNKPSKASHTDIINAIVDTVVSAAGKVERGRSFSVPVSDLPDFAQDYDRYDLERVKFKLWPLGVISESFIGDTFYFHKKR